jgi:hypothetical protein
VAKVIVCPIRLIFGISRDNFNGFAVVYERSDGTAGQKTVWFSTNKKDLFSKVRFTDTGQSRVVWEVSKGDQKPEVTEIVIRRDAQIKSSKRKKPPATDSQSI